MSRRILLVAKITKKKCEKQNLKKPLALQILLLSNFELRTSNVYHYLTIEWYCHENFKII